MTPATQGQVVLLVDGDTVRRNERGFGLESNHGYRVLAAGSVREARNILGTTPEVAAVLTQATLPDHDAVALLQRIAKAGMAGPVVLVLAEADEHGLRRLAWSEHATAVLSEPVDDSELGAALKAVLGIRGNRLDALAARAELAQGLDHLTDLLVLVL
ncbi:MAG TPA: response regulator, partial [Gemmatimonadales bacterium]|nr:response regulator [Gemmatimonadales bacterium]